MKCQPGRPEGSANRMLKELYNKVEEASLTMEKLRLAEYVEMYENPRRLLVVNFLLGLARGFGAAIGFTILAAVVIYFLQRIITLNIPVIGEFIAELVQIVQTQLNVGGLIYFF